VRREVLHQVRMAHADAQQEPPAVLLLETRVALRRLLRGDGPQIEDAGGDHRARGRRQQTLDGCERTRSGRRDPERGVTELVELAGGVAHFARVAEGESGVPDPDSSELHHHDLVSSRFASVPILPYGYRGRAGRTVQFRGRNCRYA